MPIQRVFRRRVRGTFVLGALLAPAFACSGSDQASSNPLGNGSPSDAGTTSDGTTPVILPVERPDGSGASVCSSSALSCDGGCVANDSLNCGSCGNACQGAGNASGACLLSDAGYACGVSCDAGYAPCGGVCLANATFQTDPNNCGSCGYGCMVGSCIAGVCQPWLVGTAVGNAPVQMATDGVHVVYCGDTSGVEVPLAGSTGIQLTPSNMTYGAVGFGGGKVVFGQGPTGEQTSASLWVVNDGQPSSGTSLSIGASGSPTSVAVSPDGGSAYVSMAGDEGAIYACTLGTTMSCAPLFTPPNASNSIINTLVTTPGYLFTTDVTNDRIWRIALPSGSAASIVTASGGVRGLAVDSTYVYWGSLSGSVWTIYRLSQSDPQYPEAVATLASVELMDLAADGTNVYATAWVQSDASYSGLVAYAPVAGGSPGAGAAPAAMVPIYQGDSVDAVAAAGGAVIWGDDDTATIYAVRAP
jgi:hypothetical protein